MERESSQNEAPTFCCNNMSHVAKISHLICFSYFFCLPITVWGFYAFPKINFDYSKTVQNWYMPIITDIYVSNITSLCPTAYNFVPTYQWGGTVEGCDCSQSATKISSGWPDLSRGNCTPAQITYGCFNVPSSSAQYMPAWFGPSIYCVERAFNNSFLYRSELVQPDGTCPTGTLRCGPTGNNSLDYVFCTTSPKCPINSMVVSINSPDDTLYNESIPFPTVRGTNYRLYFSRTKPNSAPISEFRVSEENVCLDNINNLSPNHSEYLLANSPRQGCSTYDPRYTLLDSMPETYYFLMNGLNLTKYLPGYTTSNTIMWNLYYRNYIEFKVSCRSMFIIVVGTALFVNDAKDQTNQAYTALISLYSCYIFIHFFLMIVVYPIRKSRGERAELLPLLSIAVNFIARISTWGLAGAGYKKSKDFIKGYEYMNGRHCSDDITNTFFDTLYFDFYSDVNMVFLALIIFNAILFSFEIVLLIVGYRITKNFEQSQQNQPKQKIPKKEDDLKQEEDPIKNKSFDSTDRSNKGMNIQEERTATKSKGKKEVSSIDPNFEFCDIEMSSSVMQREMHGEPNEEQEHHLGYLNKKETRQSKDVRPKKQKFSEKL